jgi:hypothetical protein
MRVKIRARNPRLAQQGWTLFTVQLWEESHNIIVRRVRLLLRRKSDKSPLGVQTSLARWQGESPK